MHFYTIRNTANDRSKVELHRKAPGFTPEVSIGGVRLSPGFQLHIALDHFERLRDFFLPLYENGVIEVIECKTEEGAPDPVLMRVEPAPVAEPNPHGVYEPIKHLPEQAQKVALPPAPPPPAPAPVVAVTTPAPAPIPTPVLSVPTTEPTDPSSSTQPKPKKKLM